MLVLKHRVPIVLLCFLLIIPSLWSACSNDDSGITEFAWEQTADTNVGQIYTFTTTTTGALYAGTDDGVLVSHDEGATWDRSGLDGRTILVLVDYQSALYAGTNGTSGTRPGVFHSQDDGKSWMPSGLDGLRVQHLVVSGPSFYAGTNRGLYQSEDAGKSWHPLAFAEQKIVSLQSTSSSLYVVPSSGGVFHSQNGGVSWAGSLTDKNIRGLAVIGSIVYAFQISPNPEIPQGSIYRSADDGLHWSLTTTVQLDRVEPALLSLGSYIYIGTPQGVLRMRKGFDVLDIGPADHHITALAAGASYLYAGTEMGLVFRTSDFPER